MPTGSEIRRKFLDFFVQKGHKEVHSSSLVPANDPTLLFTNAGMNQFKDVFLGLEKRDYSRATTSQKCVRAGGKHNDLENVGFTNRHHTFFEMLGNFSFGDYFKKDAIAYAWELITSSQWFGIDKGKLYVTIFEGSGEPMPVSRDVEAYDLWVAQGVAKERIFDGGLKDNFWQMGDTGPCGPCSEIHYDMGPAASDQGHTDCKFPCDCGRYVEIWNLVFMQFDRDTSGKLNPLPKPSIDTGMGLERVMAVLQGVISNYDTDLFIPLIERAAELTLGVGGKTAELRSAGQPRAAVPTRAEEGTGHVSRDHVGTAALGRAAEQSSAGSPNHKSAASLRVIADHSRAATFLISDGVLPSNEGRGYVLRKIIRRAIMHGRMLGQTKPFLNEMVSAVQGLMVDAYLELEETAGRVAKAILAEEIAFGRSLKAGLDELTGGLAHSLRTNKFLRSFAEQEGDSQLLQMLDSGKDVLETARRSAILMRKYELIPNIPGDEAFYLYDTFGLPLDFIQDLLRDIGFDFDLEGFNRLLSQQRERARASWKGGTKQTANSEYQKLPASRFEGYRQTRSSNCLVLGIFKPSSPVTRELHPSEEGEVILDHTPFYADSGGQVGDLGWLFDSEGNTVLADVLGCYMPVQGVRFHKVRARQHIEISDLVTAVVNADIRESTMRNHTATHLLHAGLREVLGKHVKQAGSLVAPDHLRFDFSHFTAVEDEELQDIEDIINKEVLRNQIVETITDVPIDEAINTYHAMALFGEKYGDKVRVVRIGDFSTELCGGTHTGATGEIGLIKILKEGSVSSGVRRVEAITGLGSLAHFRRDHELEGVVSTFAVPTLAQKLRKNGAPSAEEISAHADVISPAEALKAELEKKDSEIKRLTRELDSVRMKSASSSTANIGDQIKDVKGVKVLAHRVDNLERAQMRTLVDQLRDKIGSGVVVLGSASNGNVSLIVGVTKDLINKVQAGKVIGPVAQKVGGKGGGRPDLAEAGGKDAAALDSALDGAYAVVESLLA
ncbi:MAG TPA: alanine--tRNA ligase [Candidatus Dormibacteraeota bacterium]|jgi:alanyl-tRNA synthetase|nr:alanine--tRNA ligase [Candidatus Dormibacteraeota bacterium]